MEPNIKKELLLSLVIYTVEIIQLMPKETNNHMSCRCFMYWQDCMPAHACIALNLGLINSFLSNFSEKNNAGSDQYARSIKAAGVPTTCTEALLRTSSSLYGHIDMPLLDMTNKHEAHELSTKPTVLVRSESGIIQFYAGSGRPVTNKRTRLR